MPLLFVIQMTAFGKSAATNVRLLFVQKLPQKKAANATFEMESCDVLQKRFIYLLSIYLSIYLYSPLTRIVVNINRSVKMNEQIRFEYFYQPLYVWV